jgi:hypothetical protein
MTTATHLAMWSARRCAQGPSARVIWSAMVKFPFSIGASLIAMIDPRNFKRTKKAGVAEHPQGFDHVGLLVNEPPGPAELPFI